MSAVERRRISPQYRAGCAARQERVAELEDLAEELREAVGAQSDQIAALREQVAKLERVLSRNSGNLAIQPSGDYPPGHGKSAKKPQSAGKRSRGKRPGAPVTAMGWDVSDKTVDHYGPASAHAAGTWWGAKGCNLDRHIRNSESSFTLYAASDAC